MPTLLIRHPDGSEQTQELEGELTIGRADGNDLILVDGGVSRRHARIWLDGGQVMIEDLGSANGTFVDGERIEAPTPVGPRAQVVVGDYELAVRPAGTKARAGGARTPYPRSGESMNPARATGQMPAVKAARATRQIPAVTGNDKLAIRPKDPPPAGPPPTPTPTLRGLTGPWLNKLFPIRGTLTVGRVPGVDVHLDDDSVSRRHAEVEKTPGGIVVRDLNSANGTVINGRPVQGEAPLKPGDVVQFGVVEMVLEVSDPQVLKAPTRRDRKGDAGAGGAVGPFDPRKRRLAIIGAGVVALLVVAISLKVLTAPPEVPPDGVGGRRPDNVVVGATELEQLLAECRSFSNVELGKVDWGKAERACMKAVEIEPLHPEANQLLKEMRTKRECEQFYVQGEQAMERNREEDALLFFGKVQRECKGYYSRAMDQASELRDKVRKNAGQDCRRYVSSNNFAEALPRCELYMKIACQTMKSDDLHPPPGATLVTTSGSLRKGQWRPKDAMYLNFLKARAKVMPGAPPWLCPDVPIFRPPPKPPSEADELRATFEKRYEDKDVVKAMMLYYAGNANDARNQLLQIREKSAKAALHAVADDLMRDIGLVSARYKEGQTALQTNDPEKAESPFEDALKIDEKLMGEDQSNKIGSFFRRNIQQEMAKSAYLKGKEHADRDDFRRACKVWKLGYKFYGGNSDLLRALTNQCTRRAREALDGDSCEVLAAGFDYAVDGDGKLREGDGMRQRIEERRARLNCR